jgi:ABC-type Fe3+/spermidine/putrescine transport system ATPase subunit
MEAGRIVQEGDPRELYQKPVNRFVADFIGNANFLHVHRVGRQWQLENGSPVEIDPMTDRDNGRSKIALLRPEAIRLDAISTPTATGQNRLTGRVVGGHVSRTTRRIRRRGRRGPLAGLFPQCARTGRPRNPQIRRTRLSPRR